MIHLQLLIYLGSLLVCLDANVNVFIYAFNDRQFRKEFVSLLLCGLVRIPLKMQSTYTPAETRVSKGFVRILMLLLYFVQAMRVRYASLAMQRRERERSGTTSLPRVHSPTQIDPKANTCAGLTSTE